MTSSGTFDQFELFQHSTSLHTGHSRQHEVWRSRHVDTRRLSNRVWRERGYVKGCHVKKAWIVKLHVVQPVWHQLYWSLCHFIGIYIAMYILDIVRLIRGSDRLKYALVLYMFKELYIARVKHLITKDWRWSVTTGISQAGHDGW